MAIDCTPQSLLDAAKCFVCIPKGEQQAVKLYLLRHIAGLDSTDPKDLAALASCFDRCIPPGLQKAVESYLLCQIAGGSVNCPQDMQWAWTPTGAKLGEVWFYWNADVDTGISAMTFSGVHFGGYTLRSDNSVKSISFPALKTVGPSDFDIQNNTALISVSAPVLNTVSFSGAIKILGCAALTSINLSSLTVSNGLDCSNNPLLTTVTATNMLFDDIAQTIDFSGCALNVASVDLILHRAVVSGDTGITLDVSGGTSATPSAAGQADKAALIAAGCTVNTN